MLCKNCGAPLDGTPFCTNCGAKAEQPVNMPAGDTDATVMAPDTAAAYVAAKAEPAYQQPAQPVYQQPAQPVYQQPEQPAFQQPEQPAFQQPAQPAFQQPEQPVYQQPAQPVYQQPAQPAYQQPAQPAYQQPAYQQPAQPAYQQPAQPAYQQPEPPKKKNTGLIIGIAVAALVAVAAIVVIVLFATGVLGGEKDKDDDKKDKESATTASEQVSDEETSEDIIVAPTNGYVEPTYPTPTPNTTYDIGFNYTYIPLHLNSLGYEKICASMTFDGERMYIEADYGTDIYSYGGTIYVESIDNSKAFYVVVEDGYYWVYEGTNGSFVEATDSYEDSDVLYIIAIAELMGFDLDSAFDTVMEEMPESYTYAGVQTHPSLGTVEVFDFVVGGISYTVWVDQDTGATARLYEDGVVILETSSINADNSIVIPDYSLYS